MARTTAASTLTYSIQDYLKVVYGLTAEGGPAATNAIAARLGISAASVTGMLQRMASVKPPLVDYRKHQGVRLTNSGRRAALQVIRNHRLLETWLVRTLGYSWDNVHGEAEKLEHAMSRDLERRISHALGNPARDPHGEPIPTPGLTMPVDRSVPLAELGIGEEAIVRRVEARDSIALRKLRSIGVTIGAQLRVLGHSAVDDLVTFELRGRKQHRTIGPALSVRVYVEPVHGDSATDNTGNR